jgi:hypothetical protein
LLADIGDGEQIHHREGASVEEGRAERRGQVVALQRAERAVGRPCGTIAVRVADNARAIINGVLLVVPAAGPSSLKAHPSIARSFVVLPATLDSVSKSCV